MTNLEDHPNFWDFEYRRETAKRMVMQSDMGGGSGRRRRKKRAKTKAKSNGKTRERERGRKAIFDIDTAKAQKDRTSDAMRF